MSFRPALATLALAVVTTIALSMTGYGLEAAPIGEYRSVVDCLDAQGRPSTFRDRRLLAETEAHEEKRMMMLPYHGTGEQNRHLAEDHCGMYYTSAHPKMDPEEVREIIEGLRDTARNHGLDETRFIETARCESDGFYTRAYGDPEHQGSRGIFQINRKYHPEISDEVAYDWRKAAHFAATIFEIEHVRKDGTVISEAGNQWTCYRKNLGYGYTSARASSARNSYLDDNVVPRRIASIRPDTMIDMGQVSEIP